MRWVRNDYHLASTWLGAFTDASLQVHDCVEVPTTEAQLATTPATAFHPEAVRSAMGGLPSLWIWTVVKPDG